MRQSLFASTKTTCRVFLSDALWYNYYAFVTLGWSFSPAKTPRGRSLIRRARAWGHKQTSFLPQSGYNSRQQPCEAVSFLLVTIRIKIHHNLKKKEIQFGMQFCLVFFAFKWHHVGQGVSVLFSAYFREDDTCCTCMSGPTAITIAQPTTRIRVSCCRRTLQRT